MGFEARGGAVVGTVGDGGSSSSGASTSSGTSSGSGTSPGSALQDVTLRLVFNPLTRSLTVSLSRLKGAGAWRIWKDLRHASLVEPEKSRGKRDPDQRDFRCFAVKSKFEGLQSRLRQRWAKALFRSTLRQFALSSSMTPQVGISPSTVHLH